MEDEGGKGRDRNGWPVTLEVKKVKNERNAGMCVRLSEEGLRERRVGK